MLVFGCILYCGFDVLLTLKNGLESIALFPNEFEETTDCNLFGKNSVISNKHCSKFSNLIARFLYWTTHAKKE